MYYATRYVKNEFVRKSNKQIVFLLFRYICQYSPAGWFKAVNSSALWTSYSGIVDNFQSFIKKLFLAGPALQFPEIVKNIFMF